MYHHINSDKYSNSLELIEKHFEHISKNYNTIFPEEYKKTIFNMDLCLVFDDAYFDFYYYLFPLLQKYEIKVLLAVPIKYILNSTQLTYTERLSVEHNKIMEDDNYIRKELFCSWKELEEMSDSGYVQIVSHGYKHVRVDELNEQELDFELIESKKIIQNRLKIRCNSFVYPYGKFNNNVLDKVNKFYKYNFAIGGYPIYNIILNPIYRVYADDMNDCCSIFNKVDLLKNSLKKTIKGLIT
jgi:peptidoglycan/xylan/chitin deacetylase (PgdA/CDA1 family)